MSSAHPASNKIYLGVDAGGTFTDFVLLQNGHWHIHKVLSTPDNPAKAILQGIAELGLEKDINKKSVFIIHGSTVATNAALERKGAKTAYVTNTGFADVLTIGRQARKELYNFSPTPIEPPVPQELCLEIDCRRDAKGEVISSLTKDAILDLKRRIDSLDVEAVAINLLFSFLEDKEEKLIEDALKDDFFVSRSSYILPKYKEYERGMATWLNASLSPKVSHYMNSLIQELEGCPLSVMQSSGGTISAEQAASRAVNLLLSGPAGGLSAVKFIADQCQLSDVMSFDMGGTSTDVALMSGDFELTDEGKINDWPIAIPMLKMETIGAGGGSIAWFDKANLLHVGPQSAGSKPGPVCYNLGGKEPTVTDANLVLGRLQAKQFLGGQMELDYSKAFDVISTMAQQINMKPEELALGIVELAEEQMIKALNKISIQRGHNPEEFTLCCFGGAGGMHVCSLAEKLGMKGALIPARSGVLSAFGMLTAEKQRQYSKTHIKPLKTMTSKTFNTIFTELETLGANELKQEAGDDVKIEFARSLDLRYQGQSSTLNVPYNADSHKVFEQAHQQQFGHTMNSPIELVNVCCAISVRAEGPNTSQLTIKAHSSRPEQTVIQLPFSLQRVSLIDRDSLSPGDLINGPAIITEHVSTTWLKVGWSASVDDFGHLHLKQAN